MSKGLSKTFSEKQKKKIIEEQKKILLQVEALKKDDPFADREHASDNAAVDTDVREQVGHDTVEAEIKDLETRHKDLSIALQRIQKGKYGICEKCNKTISLTRMELVPEARFCIDCERKMHK
ncbi:TraR/DksA C4-type zinc finger protein [Candidatus Roizmanbacteria bacterium]|nr:TraR/DksA C4-type zinc finger protein [Candidatus Roizmanbacteria bacterium]